MPKHVWEEVNSPLTWDNPDVIGSGPYMLKSRTPGELVVLERNDAFIYNPRNYKSPWVETSESSVETTTETSTSTSVNNTFSTGLEIYPLLLGLIISVISVKKKKRRIN